jgi:hypothetical protein
VLSNANEPFESIIGEREGSGKVVRGLATAMPVARADTYETRDIIENHRSRATTPFRA